MNKNNGKTIYSIYEQGDKDFLRCFTDGYTKQGTIDDMLAYLDNKYDEDRASSGEKGRRVEVSEDFTLVTHVYDTGNETVETITLTWGG